MNEYEKHIAYVVSKYKRVNKSILIRNLAELELKVASICRPLSISGHEVRELSAENLEYLVRGIITGIKDFD